MPKTAPAPPQLFRSIEQLEETLQALEEQYSAVMAEAQGRQSPASPELQLMTFEESLFHLESSLSTQELLPWSPPSTRQDIEWDEEASV